jgi:hypothetical protein
MFVTKNNNLFWLNKTINLDFIKPPDGRSSEEMRKKKSEATKGKRRLSEETKEKIRIARAKQIITEEAKRKMSISNKQKWNNPVFRERMLSTNPMLQRGRLGCYHSEESKQKMSETRKRLLAEGKVIMPSTRGKHFSEEIKQKISEAMKGERNPFYGIYH